MVLTVLFVLLLMAILLPFIFVQAFMAIKLYIFAVKKVIERSQVSNKDN